MLGSTRKSKFDNDKKEEEKIQTAGVKKVSNDNKFRINTTPRLSYICTSFFLDYTKMPNLQNMVSIMSGNVRKINEELDRPENSFSERSLISNKEYNVMTYLLIPQIKLMKNSVHV